jgi:two-component system sensor histidine kinase YesM
VDGGKLKIYWYQSDKNLIIVVEDNGVGVNTKELKNLQNSLASGSNIGHNGICNVHQRLKIKYQNNYGLTITSEENKYFRNEITIPIGSKPEKD